MSLPNTAPNTAGAGQAVTTAALVLYDPSIVGRKCVAFTIANRAGSPGNVLVNVGGVHAAGDSFGLAPGQHPVEFRAKPGNIGIVTVKTDTGTATIDYGITEV